jgi:hypothetical protein
MNLLKLNSVGSVLNVEDGIVYPQLLSGLPDLEMGVELNECVEDWFESISDDDMANLMESVSPGWDLQWKS